MSEENLTLREMELELARRRLEDPLKHVYTPHEFQERIHRSRAPITIVLGGNRTGKTYGANAEALYYALDRAAWAEVPNAPNTVWYVMPSLTTLERAVYPIIKQLVPPGEIVRETDRPARFQFKNGSTIWFLSGDMQQRRLAAAAVDLIVIDEPIKKTVFDELQARTISTRGRILMVMTPVDEDMGRWLWVRDDLYIPWQTGERKDIEVIHMPVADEEGNSLVPHLTNEDIERIMIQYPDPLTRAARMYGEFVTRTGLVFGSFEPEVHLIERFDIPSNWHRWLIIDPQYHRFAALYFAADDRGNYYITDEYFSQDEQLSRRAEVLGRIVGEVDREVPAYVDYANQQDIVELNYHFRRLGIPIGAMELPFQKRVEKMILRTHSFLEPHVDRQYHMLTPRSGISGAPRLLFFNDLESTWKHHQEVMRCSRLLWEMKRLTWDSRGRPDKDSAGGADCSDCMIYGCSILASGVEEHVGSTWRTGMSDRDIGLWESIERQDRHKEFDKWRYR